MTRPAVSAAGRRRRLIPKHLINVRTLQWRIREWERKGKSEDAQRARLIYASSVKELRALGVEFKEVTT